MRFGGREKQPVHFDLEVDGLAPTALCQEFANCFWGRSLLVKFLLFVEFQTIIELAERFVDGLNGFHPVPAKIVCGVLQMIFGPS